MGGGNLQKSQMAREKKQKDAKKDGAAGGGAAGVKSRQADAGLHAAQQAERAKLNADRDERQRLKAQKEASLAAKNAKLSGASGGPVSDKDAEKRKKEKAAAALAKIQGGGAAPKAKKGKDEESEAAAPEAASMDVEEAETATESETATEAESAEMAVEAPVADEGAAEPVVADAIPQRVLSEEERVELRKAIAAREASEVELVARLAAEAAAKEDEEAAEKVRVAINAGKLANVSVEEFEQLRRAAADGASSADVESVGADLLAKKADSLLVRALLKISPTIRRLALKAASAIVSAALAASRGEPLFDALEGLIASPPGKGVEVQRVVTATLEIVGQLAGSLPKAAFSRFFDRAPALFKDSSYEVAGAAILAIASATRAAIAAGTVEASAEPTAMLTTALADMAKANSTEESAAAAGGVSAAVTALGAASLIGHGVVGTLGEIMDSKSKTAANARESAYLAVGRLCLGLKFKFEPYSIPLLPKLVKAFADKDKKVADAATLSTRALLENLATLSVKSVVGALYEGMQVVGGGGRVKVECLELASLLANRAPNTMGPCLPECIPLVIECLNDSNAKVQAAAEAALPELCSCVQNAEVAATLKEPLMLALRKPDTTLECIEEVLLTTFCNPMDGTSLAFMMPILVRGIKDSNYQLVKKAATCTSNLCALVKESSDIAPFVPLLLPLLEKNLEHSSPDVRTVSTIAKQKLLEGAGDLVDPRKRTKALADVVESGIKEAYSSLPASVFTYVAETSAALLEEKLGGVVSVKYFRDAVGQCAEWISSNLDGLTAVDEVAITKVAAAAVDCFRELLSDEAKRILADSGDKDFALDMQNIILAFAGRVLLRKADIRFERGHRYGLIGQNGTGKTTLLNRLAAKDINGFPQHLRTWYIRHEVLCDDGIDVKTFLKQLAPHVTDEAIEGILDQVQFPEEMKTTFVNSLSGGWKMRMSVAISILQEPELLLLDEPTNHLDRDAIEWLTQHLLSLKDVTIAVVSHDYDFIDEVCTDITHYDNGGELGKPCRFVYYPMTFKEFQELKPEIAAGLPRADKGVASAADVLAANKTPSEVSAASSKQSSAASEQSDSLAASVDKMSITSGSETTSSDVSTTISKVDEMIAAGLILPMRFPDPGKPDGIRTFRKPILTLDKVSFKYPETDKYILNEVGAQLTLGSRAVIVGGNGSGKSTFLKLLIGDIEPEEGKGTSWKHHNLRLSYVAQQSLHHLEDFVTVTPIHYIQERFRQGLDAEVGKLKTLALTEEEEKLMGELGQVNAVVGRQQRGRALWYEVTKTGRGGTTGDAQYFPLTEIEQTMKPYVKKLIKNFDQKAQALESGMAIRPITAAEILAHLGDFGIDTQLAHGKIRQMSGGQRQRLVICAAFWSKPHVIALDEPTNYLDNDSVAALTKALKDFKGAVVTVSENEAFVAEISNEKWVVEEGKVTIVQLRDAKAR